MTMQTLTPEDQDRINLYALLAGLFGDRPADTTLALITRFQIDQPPPLIAAWNAVADAVAAQGGEAIRAEYDALFIGIGKPEFFLNGSYHLTGFLHEAPLAALREELRQLGLQRHTESGQTEDHLAALCETMCVLVERGDAQQQGFFDRHLRSWIGDALTALSTHPAARFYRCVAVLAQQFFLLEEAAAQYVAN